MNLSHLWNRFSLHIGFLIVLVLGLWLHLNRSWEPLEFFVLDHQFTLLRKHPQPLANDVVVVGIDEAAYKQFREPFALWHPHLGEFFRAMAEARPSVVGLDIVLPSRSYQFLAPGYDQALLQGLIAMRGSVPVVLSQSLDDAGKTRPIFSPFVSEVGTDALTSPLTCPDKDGVTRHIDSNECVGVMLSEGMSAKLGIKREWHGLIDYSQGTAFNYIPFTQVLDWYEQRNTEQLARVFHNKPVLLGAILPFSDRHPMPAPIAAWEPGNSRLPGVLIHAQSLRSMLNRGLITTIAPGLLLIFTLLPALFWWGGSTKIKGGMLIAFSIGILALSTLRLSQGHYLPTTDAIGMAWIAFVGRSIFDSLKQYQEKILLRAQTVDLLQRLAKLNAIGIDLSSERDINRLLENILAAVKRIIHADAATLYLLDAEQQQLRFEIIHNDSLGITMGGISGRPISFSPIPLKDETGNPNDKMVAACSALTGKTINIADAYTAEGYDFSGTKEFDKKTGYRSISFLTVPMLDHEGEVIGVLQLINALNPEGDKVVPFTKEDVHLAESLASQAAIALSNRYLIKQLESLFESLVKLISTAIDDKSPYTSGHCQRVPVLTMMLAEAVCRTSEGPLKDFSMTEREKYELRIAGLLHDCGKITTPVHVVDKATKLETLFDRIHLLDTRIEVLKCNAELAMVSGMQNPDQAVKTEEQRAAIFTEYQQRIRQLDEDREFLHRCNIGGEFMSDESQARVLQIAAYEWRDPEGNLSSFLSTDEVNNLNIPYGTLSPEERKIINHHIEVTIKMLESLPWPRHLKKVPEYAGSHHERMDGKGYPRGLKREQMSLPARMIGIADIFEALTAKDRPYKKGKSLTESLTILGKLKLDGHIDPDIFDVFVREKVYLEYAQQFLAPEQMDQIDLGKIPGYQP